MSKQDKKEHKAQDQPVDDVQAAGCPAGEPTGGAPGADTVADEGGRADDSSARLAQELDCWKDKYVRLSAEFDNYRKRTLREKMELVAMGGEEVIRSLLGVLDDMDRAVASLSGARDLEAVKQGVVLIRQKLDEVLRARNVSEIEALGLPLDTDLHEAVAKFPVEEESRRGRIIDVVQKGYKMGDKVVRHARVVVGE